MVGTGAWIDFDVADTLCADPSDGYSGDWGPGEWYEEMLHMPSRSYFMKNYTNNGYDLCKRALFETKHWDTYGREGIWMRQAMPTYK